MKELRKTIEALEELTVSVVRNMQNFTINDVLESDVRLLMMTLDDKKERAEKGNKTGVIDFTKMTTDEARRQLEGRQ